MPAAIYTLYIKIIWCMWLQQPRSMSYALSTSYARIPPDQQQINNVLSFSKAW